MDDEVNNNNPESDLNSIVESSNNINNQFKGIKDSFKNAVIEISSDSEDSISISDNSFEDRDAVANYQREKEEQIHSESENSQEEQYIIDHELKVIYKLRILLNECEKLSKKTNSLKLKTNKESSIYQAQNELIESINNNKASKQKLKEESQGIDSKTSILYLNKLNEDDNK